MFLISGKNKFFQKLAIFLAIIFCNINFLLAQMVGADTYIKATSLEIGLDSVGGFEGCSIFS